MTIRMDHGSAGGGATAKAPAIEVPGTIDVLIAESDPDFLAQTDAALAKAPRIRVVARTSTAPEAVQRALRSRPDLCLLDAGMPGSGVSAAWEIRARLPWAKIVLMSEHALDDDLFGALRSGVEGFLLKDMNLDRLAPALVDVYNGNAAVPRNLVARMLSDYRTSDPSWRSVAARDGVRGRVTSREWEVIEMLGRDMSTYEIAQRLFVTPSAVRCHISSAVRKLGVRNRGELLQVFQRGAA
jgi:DNA-binding NarL/FixJ family response regulator